MLKNNDWEDLVLSEMKEKKIRNLRSMVSKTKTSKKNVTSALSAMLKEARKNFRNATKENEVGVKTPTFRCVTPHKNTWVVRMNLLSCIQIIPYSFILFPGRRL